MDTDRILAIFTLKHMDMDMDDGRASWTLMEKPEKYTALGLPAGPPR